MLKEIYQNGLFFWSRSWILWKLRPLEVNHPYQEALFFQFSWKWPFLIHDHMKRNIQNFLLNYISIGTLVLKYTVIEDQSRYKITTLTKLFTLHCSFKPGKKGYAFPFLGLSLFSILNTLGEKLPGCINTS